MLPAAAVPKYFSRRERGLMHTFLKWRLLVVPIVGTGIIDIASYSPARLIVQIRWISDYF